MVKVTKNEIRDILISMFVISLAFAIIFAKKDLINAIVLVPLTFVVVGLGFVLHELAHKFVAIKYGYWAEYKMWPQGLVLALITAYFGIVFAAPGAVYIHGQSIRKSENGIISIAGPLTNIILAILFLIFASAFSSIGYVIIAISGATINSFLAVFNLIPIAIFDGAKVFRWNPIIWILVFGFSLILLAYTMFGISLI